MSYSRMRVGSTRKIMQKRRPASRSKIARDRVAKPRGLWKPSWIRKSPHQRLRAREWTRLGSNQFVLRVGLRRLDARKVSEVIEDLVSLATHGKARSSRRASWPCGTSVEERPRGRSRWNRTISSTDMSRDGAQHWLRTALAWGECSAMASVTGIEPVFSVRETDVLSRWTTPTKTFVLRIRSDDSR